MKFQGSGRILWSLFCTFFNSSRSQVMKCLFIISLQSDFSFTRRGFFRQMQANKRKNFMEGWNCVLSFSISTFGAFSIHIHRSFPSFFRSCSLSPVLFTFCCCLYCILIRKLRNVREANFFFFSLYKV